MKIINGVEVPETLREARKMNYHQLEAACEAFNSHGLSVSDIEKAWHEQFLHGFNACLQIVFNYLEKCEEVVGFRECLKEDILKEVNLHLKNNK